MSTDLLYTIDIPRPAGKHVCVPELLERVRFDFDIAATSLRLTDAQLLGVINRSRDRLFKLLVDLDESYFRYRTTLTTTQDAAAVTLPERLYAPVKLAYTNTDGNEREIPRANDDRGRLIAPREPAWEQTRPYYYLTPTELVLYPTPAAPRTLQLVFLQSWVDLVAPPGEPSCWDVQPTWDDWVVLDVCVRLSRRSRRKDDVATFTDERNELTRQYMSALRNEQFEGPNFARRVMFSGDEDDC